MVAGAICTDGGEIALIKLIFDGEADDASGKEHKTIKSFFEELAATLKVRSDRIIVRLDWSTLSSISISSSMTDVIHRQSEICKARRTITNGAPSASEAESDRAPRIFK